MSFTSKKVRRSRIGLVVSLFLAVLVASPAVFAWAPVDSARAWLLESQRADGAIASADDLATPEQATGEALASLAATGAVRDAGLAFLGAAPVETQPTEYLARFLIAAGEATASDALTELRQRQNTDGGFAPYDGMPSTVLDTAHALKALTETDVTASRNAVAYLLNTRTGNGWTDTAGELDVALTLQVWHALFTQRHVDTRIPAALDAALAELDAPVDEHFMEALRVRALMLRSSDASSYSSSLQNFLAAQLPDGSWAGDVYTTALALRVLELATDPSPNPDLGELRGVLLDGERGSALSGVTVTLSGNVDRATVTDAAGGFSIAGLPAGSYAIDATVPGYTDLTVALEIARGDNVDLGVVRLFTLADPSLAVFAGRVFAATGEPLTGARIALTGAATATATSGDDGGFHAGGLVPGAYTAVVSHDGYVPEQRYISLEAGRTAFMEARLDVEPLREFHLSGRILHGETGMPLQDVSIGVSGDATATFVTDASGAYAGAVTGSGIVQLTASRDGFESVALTRVAAGSATLEFSPALFPIGSDDPRAQRGGLRGRVIDAFTGVPVVDASLRLTGASNAATATTDANGVFQFELQAAENSVLETSNEGYQEDTRMAVPVAGVMLEIGDIALLPGTGSYPVSVGGTVVDSITGEPIAGVNVVAHQQDERWQVITGEDGAFTFEVNRIHTASIEFSRQDYGGETVVFVPHLSGENLGRIRLRPDSADAPLPDLMIGAVATGGGFSDPFSFNATGTLHVSLLNRGSQAVATAFDLVAFTDADGDGLFTSGPDTEHGRVTFANGIEPGGEAGVQLPLRGALMFRDAPLAIAVDPVNHVIEQSESNNVSSTAAACRAVPNVGTINPVHKYQAMRGRKMMTTALVANLTDDNGDGAIDDRDSPDIAVPVFEGFGQFNGASIYVIDGATGAPLFDTEGVRNVAALSEIAIADIDGDDLPEIVAADSSGNHLIAFEHDGTQKWLSEFDPLPGRSDGAGAISIADLDGDGVPEIIIGASVYSNSGQLLADGRDLGGSTGFKLYTSLSAVADVDLDGVPEILAGPTTYEFRDGVLSIDRRRADVPDGFVGVANFDADDFAEIVLVGRGEVRVLNHDGSDLTSWAPGSGGIAAVPGGGYAGPPTIADMDGDGEVEIGIAGASFYVVFNADGSILWQSPIQDISSQVTGSTSFDFQGDGTAEIIYRDEMKLRIYRGADGSVLYEKPLRSGTATEVPVVADVDADGHAEIVVTSDHHFGGTLDDTGVNVFEDAADSWLDTRSIWNQNSYHITNINDDASVPANEQASWLTHNTYRLNTFPDRDPLQAADLTLGRLEIVDSGAGQPMSLRARIGNGGIVPSGDGVIVSFHDGADSTAPLLGTVSLPAMAPGEWRDIALENVLNVSGVSGVFAVIDAGAQSTDCATANNQLWQAGLPTVGGIGVTTDAPSYAPEQAVTLNAVIDNTGTFTREFAAVLRIEDVNGNVVSEFAVQQLGELASGEQRVIHEAWNTARYLAGNYTVHASLFDAAGVQLASSASGFTIAHDAQSGPVAELRLTTDRARYHTSDQVRFDLLAQNQSVSTLLTASDVRVTVVNAASEVVFDESLAVRELSSGNAQTLFATLVLNRAAIGAYHATAVWRGADDAVLATAEREFEVFEDLSLALRGSVTVASPQLYVGDSQICTETATNTGTSSATVRFRHTLARLDQPGASIGTPFSATLASDASRTWLHGVNTAGFAAGDYACVLEAETNGSWQPLGNAFFRLDPPPIRIEAAMTAGERGQVLVLLDPACADRDPPEGEGGTCDSEPYGPDAAPPLPIQRAHLEAVLDAAGWKHTIVTNAEDFATALESDAYELYALLNEQVKLPEAVQHDVVADIAAGRGLLVAGNHDRRNGRLEEALGIHSLGKNLDIEALVVEPFGEHEGGELTFFIAQAPNAVRVEGADTLAEFRLVPKGNKTPATEPAITRNAHGEGAGIYAAFDLPVQSATEGDDGGFASLLTATLDVAHPEPYVPVAGRVFPLVLQLQNEGMATAGDVQLALPPGVTLVEGVEGTVVADGVATWPFTLAEEQLRTFTVWIRLPETAGPFALEAVIYAGDDESRAEFARADIVLNVVEE